MGVTFEETKRRKLNRMLGLRIMNALGMIAWRADEYGEAKQYLRILHPLSWPWFIGMILFAVVMYGGIEVWQELKTFWRNEWVWW